MSWSRRTGRPGGAGILCRCTLTVALCVALAGCGTNGLRPMYGATQSGERLTMRLAQVDFSKVPGRVGQRLRNELVFQSTGGGGQIDPRYRLQVAIRESVRTSLVERQGDSRSQTYNLDVSFKLIRLNDKSIALEGRSYGRASFQRFDSIFSNVRAKRDAENRAADTVAREINTRLAAYLATQT
ncbi:MAG: LPS assembly lipoprotein LptE [Pseudomonadota bacterium]